MIMEIFWKPEYKTDLHKFFKLKMGRLRLDIRKTFFTWRWGWTGTNCLQVWGILWAFKARLDGIPGPGTRGRVPARWRSWNRMILKAPSNPNYSMIACKIKDIHLSQAFFFKKETYGKLILDHLAPQLVRFYQLVKQHFFVFCTLWK